MERLNRKRKVTFLDLYENENKDVENNKNIDRIILDFKKISITRKRKFDKIIDECTQINKYIKTYSCSLHDNDKEICNIYNCLGMNYCDMEIHIFDYIN